MRQELDTHVSVRQAICEAPFRTPQFAVLRQSSLRFLGVQGMTQNAHGRSTILLTIRRGAIWRYAELYGSHNVRRNEAKKRASHGWGQKARPHRTT